MSVRPSLRWGGRTFLDVGGSGCTEDRLRVRARYGVSVSVASVASAMAGRDQSIG